ncbi:hypothetical protein GEMRC1_005149 [Eukaryota sp. GEM-RC1]
MPLKKRQPPSPADHWSKILQIHTIPERTSVPNSKFTSAYHHQVRCDVQRSMWSLLTTKPSVNNRLSSEETLSNSRKDLENIVCSCLSSIDDLHYYQGFHEIVETVYRSTFDVSLSIQIMSRYLSLVNLFLWKLDPTVARYLEDSQHSPPYFAVSWVLTWFSHCLDSFCIKRKLFEFFIESSPLAPAVISALVISRKRTALLAQERDFSVCHAAFSQLDDDIPWNTLIQKAKEILDTQMPDEVLSDAKMDPLLKNCLLSWPYNFASDSDIARGKKRRSRAEETVFWSTIAFGLVTATATVVLQNFS